MRTFFRKHIRARLIGTSVRFIRHKVRIGKRIRKLMKNAPKKGRSVRNGNAPSPYSKYGKRPYQYNFKATKVVDIAPISGSKEARGQVRKVA